MTTPPGWYDDGHGALRWWDGSRWTEHVQPVAAAVPVAAPAPAATAATASPLPGQYGAEAPEPSVAEQFGSGPHGAEGYGIPPVPVAPAGATVPPYAEAPTYATVPPYANSTPGGPTGASPWAPQQPARPSKLWILWVVLGVVALGIVIAVIAIVPRLVAQLAGGGSAAPATQAEQEAVDAVLLYDDAWQQGDCDAYFAATTERFRNDFEITTCDDFESASRSFVADVEDYVLTVTGVQATNAAILVETSEAYLLLNDESGSPIDPPESVEDTYLYTVVDDAGAWRIDEIG